MNKDARIELILAIKRNNISAYEFLFEISHQGSYRNVNSQLNRGYYPSEIITACIQFRESYYGSNFWIKIYNKERGYELQRNIF